MCPAANPVTSLLAQEGIGALACGAPAAVARPGDLDARSLTLSAPTSRLLVRRGRRWAFTTGSATSSAVP